LLYRIYCLIFAKNESLSMSAERIVLINLLLYFFGFLFFLSQRNKLKEQYIAYLSILINGVGVLFSLGIRLSDAFGDSIVFEWFRLGNQSFTLSILVNDLTYLMYFLVQFIAFWVQVFSMKYMKGDESFGRYYSYLNLFIMAMLGIVLSGNLLSLFMAWELVGLCSYLLVGFWFKKPSATRASMKAFLVNRVGDIGFLIGLFLVYRYFGTFDLLEITAKTQKLSPDFLNSPEITTVGILLFCGCMAKSAQLPLQVWLPDAMEGPTPVSALIHAATMVAAGIFMIARVYPIISEDARYFMAIIGSITMFLGALSALFQYDIKKLLAYSTISQLGLMVVGLGVGAVNAALFHLLTHAFFKAGLFLAAGAVIHHTHHEQDMRKMGNLRKKIPLVFIGYSICAASLAGIPFFSGFLSKDAILIATFAWADNHPIKFISAILCLISAGLGAFYMMRQTYLVFFERTNNPLKFIASGANSFIQNLTEKLNNIVKVEDADDKDDVIEKSILGVLSKFGILETPIIVMAMASFGFIYAANPFSFESAWFFQTFKFEVHSHHWIANVTILFSLISLILGYILTKDEVENFDLSKNEPINFWQRFIFNNYYLSELYQKYLVEPLVRLSPGFSKFDQNIIDKLVNKSSEITLKLSQWHVWFEQRLVDNLVNTIADKVDTIGERIRTIQNGKIQSYLLIVFVFVLLIFILLLAK